MLGAARPGVNRAPRGGPPPARAPAAPPRGARARTMRLLYDATTALAWADRPPVGTVRVERLALADLCRRLPPDRLVFAKVRGGAFVPVTPAQARLLRGLGGGRPIPGGGEEPAPARAPGLVRRLRRALRRRMERRSPPAAVPTGAFSGCTSFVTLGHGWDYLDHDALRGLKQRLGLQVHAFVHDLIAVDRPHLFHEPERADRLRRHHAELCRIADGLIANSHATRQALEGFIARERLPRPRLRVAVLPGLALDGADAGEAALPAGLAGEPFVLYVSTLESRKNHRLLLRLWSECARAGRGLPRLVLVGRIGWGVEEALRMLRHDPALAGRVLLLENVGDALLVALYRRCLFTLYPSLAEGWGWPISEALSLGRICVHAEDPAQREAAQGLAPSCHPDDFMAWREQILLLSSDGARRAELEARIRGSYRPRPASAFCADLRAALGLD